MEVQLVLLQVHLRWQEEVGSGMIMHLNKVPAREEGMTPYDFMLSESQERMLICAKKVL